MGVVQFMSTEYSCYDAVMTSKYSEINMLMRVEAGVIPSQDSLYSGVVFLPN